MEDRTKTKKQLIEELLTLREQLRELRAAKESIAQVRREGEDIFQAIGHPAIILDAQHNILSLNRAAVKAVGAGSAEELTGRKCYEIFHNAAEPPKGCPLVKMLASATLEESDMDVEALGGIFHVSCTPVFDEEGTLQRIIHIAMDITKHRQAEESLRREKTFSDTIINSLPGIFYLFDENGHFVRWNRNFEIVSGCSSEEMEKMNALDFFSGGEKNLVGEAIQEVFVKGESNVEADFIAKDGRRIPYYFTGLRFISDGRPYLVGMGIDITVRKQNEVALRDSEEKYHSVMENASDAIILADMDGNFLDANKKAEELLGYTKEKLMTMDYKNIHPQEDLGRAADSFTEIIFKGFTYMRDIAVLKNDGKTVPVDITGSLISYGDKLIVQGIFRDITEQKRIEQEKKKIEEQLFQAQKMEAIGTLAGGIAHDFNNLLMGILGYTSLMLMKTDKSNPFYERLKIIEKQVESGTDLTRQLLGFARGGKYEVKPVNINDLVVKTSNVFGHTKKEISIHRKLQQDIHTVEADRGQIEQMLLNLYVNAWQAMPSGGELYLETRNVVLDEQYCRPFDAKPGPYVKIQVTDTGVGMDAETRHRIFEPFFTTKDMSRGTGLGLASVYGIIKNHGGIINVYSEKGHGATFTVYLPASEKEVPGESKKEEEIVHGHETILIVDDEQANIDSLKEVLETLGYKTMMATNGHQTLQLYKTYHREIDLVILDMIMPVMNGREIFLKLKEINSNVKVLLSSGYSIDGEAAKILELGCNGFIQKPFSVIDLSRKIREVLDS